MTRAPLLFFSLFLTAGLQAASLSAPAWNVSVADPGVGNGTSLVLDAAGNPRICYYSNQSLKYARWDGMAWTISAVDVLQDIGYAPSMKLDAAGNPHIVYHDKVTIGLSRDPVIVGSLKYARWTGTAWTTSTVHSATGSVTDSAEDVGYYSSLALDAAGNPHVAYYDSALKYARWTGTAWTTSTVESGGVGSDASIAVDAAGNPHIIYGDINNADLKYARWTGTAWTTSTVDSAGNVGLFASLALDPDGKPHAAYYDNAPNTHLKHARWTGVDWLITTVDATMGSGYYTSIAVDAAGHPHISYYNADQGDLKYTSFSGTAWMVSTVESPGMKGLHTSIALDAAGNPHISYVDGDISDVKYAKSTFARPTGVHLSSLSATALTWAWTDNADDETGYRVLSDGVNVSGDLPSNTVSWTQAGLSPNTSSHIVVQAFNSSAALSSTSSVSGHTMANPPAGSAAVDVTSHSVSLAWSSNGNPAGTLYRVEKSTDNLSFMEFFSGTGLSTTAQSLLSLTSYYFRVRAENVEGLPTDHDAVVTTLTGPFPLEAPGAPLVSGRTTSSIVWSWGDPSSREDGFRVRRVSDDVVLSTLPANSTQWSQTGLGTNSRQQVRVEVFAGTETAVSADSAAAHSLANPPTNSTATAVSDVSVSLSWSNNSNPNGTGYKITTTQAGGDSQTTEVVGSGPTITKTISGLQPDTDHTFRVQAMNADGILSDPDADLFARTPPPSNPPAAPGAPSISNLTSTAIAWRWADNAVNEAGYRVRSAAGDAELSGNLPAGTTAWIQTGLSPNTPHKVYVQSFNVAGVGDSIGSESVYTLANPPTDVRTRFTGDSMDVTWSRNGNPTNTKYVAQIWAVDGATMTQTTAGVQARFTNGIKLNAEYFLSVAAINEDGVPSPALGALSAFTAPENAPHPYPVPWRPDSGKPITFTRLPSPAKIRIYTLSGKLVRELSPDAGAPSTDWDVKNADGDDAATGTYIYVVESPASRKTGKLVVAR